MRTEAVDTNIFKSNAQYLHTIEPANIRPLWDRLLVKDIPDPDKIGSIFIPETAAERGVGKGGLARLGIVVAVGPGDKFTREWVERNSVTGQHQVMRKALGVCRLSKQGICFEGKVFDIASYSKIECPECKGAGIRRWEMYCHVGDTIVYERRKEAELFIGGVRYGLIHEEQAVLGILSPFEEIRDGELTVCMEDRKF